MPLNPYDTRPLPMQQMVPQAPARVIVQQVNAIEPRTGPWSGNVELGRWVTPEVPALRRQPLIQMAEWGKPRVMTLLISSVGDLAPFSAISTIDSEPHPALQAEVTVGCGGATHAFLMDIEPGSQVSFVGNSVKVDILYPNGVAVGTSSPNTQIVAMLGDGPVGRGFATCSYKALVFPAPSFTVLPIPRMAGAFKILGDFSNTDFLSMYLSGPYLRIPFNTFDGAGGSVNWIPLGGFDTGSSFTIYNPSASNVNVSIIYRLNV